MSLALYRSHTVPGRLQRSKGRSTSPTRSAKPSEAGA